VGALNGPHILGTLVPGSRAQHHFRTHAPQQAALFNYVIGTRERVGGIEMPRVLAVLRLIAGSNSWDRRIGRLFAFQNASRIRTGFPIRIGEAEADCGAALR
jgi:hypothetical protein